MKSLDLSAVTAAIRFPFKEGTMEFLQLAYKELFAALTTSRSGFANNSILYGCLATSDGVTTAVSAGAIFFNGEIYLTNSSSFADPSGGQVIIGNFVTTQYTTNADPVTFVGSGASTLNVHNDKKISWSAGTSHTGVTDLLDLFTFLKVTSWSNVGINLYNSGGIHWQAVAIPTSNTAGYMISEDVLRLSGQYKNIGSVGATPTPIFNIPLVFAPKNNASTSCWCNLNGSAKQQVELNLDPTGLLSSPISLGANTVIYLDGFNVRIS